MATTPLTPDFQDLLTIFNSHKIEYLLVGGYAVISYGHVRATKDFDVWVLGTEDNAARVTEAIREFGFDVPGLATDTFTSGVRTKVIQMGVAPNRIEILTAIDGVSFVDCYPRRVTVDWDGLEVPVISRDDLLANKAASGRPQDLADIDALRRVIAAEAVGASADG